MAYADLYADADLYIPFNNSATASINTGSVSSTTGNTARTYSSDVPANLGTAYSLACTPNNSGSTLTPYVDTYTLPHANASAKQTCTISFWYKYSTSNGLANLIIDNAFHGGNIYASNSGGLTVIDSQQWRPGITVSPISEAISADTWHHIAYVFNWKDTTDTYNAISRTLYVDGIATDTNADANLEFLNVDNAYVSPNYLIAYAAGATGMTGKLAHFAVWNNKALSPIEIYNLAKYGMLQINQSQITQISSLNPFLYFPLETITETNYASDLAVKFGTGASTFTAGKFNNCLRATSTNYSYIQSATAATTIKSPFAKSFSFWIKRTSTSGVVRYVMQKRNDSIPAQRFQIRISADEQIGLFVRDPGFGWIYNDPSAGHVLPLNTWTHVVLTMGGSDANGGTAGGDAKIYYDGSIVWTESLSDALQDPFTTNSEIYFNRQSNNAGTYSSSGTSYEGYDLDEFAIFDYELSAAQVKQIWDARNQLKHWDGDSWEFPIKTQIRGSSAWIDGTWKHWDGFQWQPLNIAK